RAKDYWRKNIATWKDAKKPTLVDVELDLALEPARGTFKAKGRYGLKNLEDVALRQIAITPGSHFEHREWTLAGARAEPGARAGLLVFPPPEPLAPQHSLELGFSYDGRFPNGVSKNGGGASEFILPSGVVLTSFGPQIVPAIGFLDAIGVDEDNKSD